MADSMVQIEAEYAFVDGIDEGTVPTETITLEDYQAQQIAPRYVIDCGQEWEGSRTHCCDVFYYDRLHVRRQIRRWALTKRDAYKLAVDALQKALAEDAARDEADRQAQARNAQEADAQRDGWTPGRVGQGTKIHLISGAAARCGASKGRVSPTPGRDVTCERCRKLASR